MKKKLFSLVRIFLAALLMTGIFGVSYWYLDKVFHNEEVSFSDDPFQAMPENSIDVLVLGSSHAEHSFSPGIFYTQTGLYAYDFTSACQPYEVSVEMLEEVYKRQDPKLLIFEVFTVMPLKAGCDDDSCYIISQSKVTGQERYDILSYLPDEKRQAIMNEFLNNHNDWKELEDLSVFLPENAFREVEIPEVEIDPNFGYTALEGQWSYPENWWHASYYDDVAEVSLEEIDLYSLERIYEICEEHGTKILFYKTPINGIDEENQAYLNEVWKWAEVHGIPYIDFIRLSKDLGFYMGIHSLDFHANIAGAGIITTYLADTVNSMGVSFDHQNNDELNSLYLNNGEDLMIKDMVFEHDPVKYMHMLEGKTGYRFLRYIPNKETLPNELINAIHQAGFTDFNPYQPYLGAVANGEVHSNIEGCYTYIRDGLEIYITLDGLQENWGNINDPSSNMTFVYYPSSGDDRIIKEIFYDPYNCFDKDYTDYDWDH